MLTQIFVTGHNPDEVPQDMVSHRWADFNQGNTEPAPKLKFDQVAGYDYYQYTGRLTAIPWVLDNLAVVQVTIKHRSVVTDESPRAGRYSSPEATAFVEHSIPPSANEIVGNYQYITVEGKTLRAANRMLDAVIGLQLNPDKVKPMPRRRPLHCKPPLFRRRTAQPYTN